MLNCYFNSGAAAIVKCEDCAPENFCSGYDETCHCHEADWMVFVEEYFLAWGLLVYICDLVHSIVVCMATPFHLGRVRGL